MLDEEASTGIEVEARTPAKEGYSLDVMKPWIFRLAVIVFVILAGLLAKSTVLAQKPVPVKVIEVTRGQVESTVTNSRAGTVKVRRRAKLSPPIGGRVVELPFREGMLVKAGDLLLRLDGEVQEAQLKLSERQVASAQARHSESGQAAERAEQELKRNRMLAERKIISDDQLDEFLSRRDRAVLASESSKALVEEARASSDLARAHVAQTKLHAPFSGVLAEMQVEVGEYVTPSPPGVNLPTLLDLIDPASSYLSAPMDEVDSAVISVGLPVRVTIDPFPGQEFAGKVVRIAPFVLDFEAQNRTIEIEVELVDVEMAQRLLPGTSSDVEVILRTADDVLRVPTSALLEGGRLLIFENGQLAERKVQVGLRNWNWVEVTGGLQGGEQVVTNLGDIGVEAGAMATLTETP